MVYATAYFPNGDTWGFSGSWVSIVHLWAKNEFAIGATAVRVAQDGRLIAVIRPRREAQRVMAFSSLHGERSVAQRHTVQEAHAWAAGQIMIMRGPVLLFRARRLIAVIRSKRRAA